MYPIQRSYLPIRPNVRPGHRLKPTFFVAHDIGTGGSTAYQNYQYFSRQIDRSASAHVFIDDVEIREIIPTGLVSVPAEKAWHVIYDVPTDNQRFGIDANDGAIGVELCWGKKIDFAKAYSKYVWYFAQLCQHYHKEPKTHIVGHFQLDPKRKQDPIQAFRTRGITWEQFLYDVEEAMTMNLTDLQWKMLEQAFLQQYTQGRFTDETWLKKVKNRSLTVSECSFLNQIILTRLSQTPPL